MKKQLEAELISLAHRILQLKNKSETKVLQQEALKLYEKLSVLAFVEEHFSSPQPTIGRNETLAQVEEVFQSLQNQKEEVAQEEEHPNIEVSSVIAQLAASKSVVEEDEENMEAELIEASEQLDTDKTTLSEEEDSEMEIEEDSVVDSEEIQESEPVASTQNEKVTTAFGESFIDPDTIIFDRVEENPTDTALPFEATLDEETSNDIAEEEIILNQEEEEFEDEEIGEPVLKIVEESAEDSAQSEDASDIDPIDKPIEEVLKFETPDEKEVKETGLFTPAFELDFQAQPADPKKYDETAPSFTFDDLLGENYHDPVFVTPEELEKEAQEPVKTFSEDIFSRRPFESTSGTSFEKPTSSTLNDKLSKGITIGLNDRIAFMKNLFNNSSEDYNRVLSQLMTIDNYAEARQFIQEMVKPDYNNWAGKEEFEQRFMEIVEKRFL